MHSTGVGLFASSNFSKKKSSALFDALVIAEKLDTFCLVLKRAWRHKFK